MKKRAQGFNTAAQDSNPGSLSQAIVLYSSYLLDLFFMLCGDINSLQIG